jgi:hypothetical protein
LARKTAKKKHDLEERGSRSPDKKKRRGGNIGDDSPVGFMNMKKLTEFEN